MVRLIFARNKYCSMASYIQYQPRHRCVKNILSNVYCINAFISSTCCLFAHKIWQCWRDVRLQIRQWRQKQQLLFQKWFILPLSWVMLLLVTILWIVFTCDCYLFVDFLMVGALLVQNYQIKLLKGLVCSLRLVYLIECICRSTWGTLRLLKYNVWKWTETRAGAMKKESSWKPRALELEPCSWKKSPWARAVSFLWRLRSPEIIHTDNPE